MNRFLLALSLFAFVSCDSHEWEGEEGTKRLFESHGSHDSHSGHGDEHDSSDDHGNKGESHSEDHH